MRCRSLAVAALLMALGCDTSSPGPEPPAPSAMPKASASAAAAPSLPPPSPPSLSAEDTVAAYERLAAVFGEHADADCGALASALETFVKKESDAFSLVSDAVVARLEENPGRAERFRKAMEPIMTGSMRCKTDARLRAILDGLAKARAERRTL